MRCSHTPGARPGTPTTAPPVADTVSTSGPYVVARPSDGPLSRVPLSVARWALEAVLVNDTRNPAATSGVAVGRGPPKSIVGVAVGWAPSPPPPPQAASTDAVANSTNRRRIL